MELRQIKYFLGVAETLNFSKAAVNLNIVQPALSRALKELESELGVQLVDARGGARGILVARVLGGAHDAELTVVIRFPSLDAAHGWFDSPAYQRLIPLRMAAADVELVSFSG